MGIFNKKQVIEKNQETEPTMAEQINDESIEKGMPDVADVQQGSSNMKKVGLFLGILFATGLIATGLIVFTSSGDDENQASKQEDTEMVAATQSHDFGQDKSDIRQQEALELTAASKPNPQAASDVQAASAAEPIGLADNANSQTQPETVPPMQSTDTASAEPEKVVTPRDRKLLGGVLIVVSGNGNDENSGSLNGGNDGANDGEAFRAMPVADEATASQENPLEAQLHPTQTASVRARQRGNMDYILSKGTNILCTLDTQIITTRAGFTRCIITRDIYSANGKVLLLEKGSRIVGEQTAALLQGQARVGILWNEVTTPKGVTVQLASPAAGQLGAAGVEARVKYHFWQRFGGAIMISLIGDLGDYYSNKANNSDGQRISFENSSEAAQDMATEALKNSINIPPTGYINHGTLINIMVARDVDFSGVYERVNPFQF